MKMKFRSQVDFFFLPGIALAIVLVLMFIASREYDLSNQSVWFDKAMHVLGGAGSCSLGCWVIVNLPASLRTRILSLGFPLIGRVSALFFGIDWEVAEALFPIITENIPQGRWDTGFDLLFDYIGGHIAGKLYERRVRQLGGE